jgi:two-component system NarL family response regulator
LIADDHPVMRLGLATLCQTQPDLEVCAEAENGAAAVARYREHRPDVALLDLRMPVMDGIRACTAILTFDPVARVIILSSFDAIDEIHQAVSAGARGYFLKQLVGDDLVHGIRTVSAGHHCIPPAVALRLAERAAQSGLSAREIEILQLIAKGCTNKEIASYLAIAAFTVRNHVAHIFEKLAASDRAEAVVIALERGILRLE